MADRYSPSLRIEHAEKFIGITDLLNRGLAEESSALFRTHQKALASMGGSMAHQLPRLEGAASDAGDAVAPSADYFAPSLRIEHAEKLIEITDLLRKVMPDESFSLFRTHHVAMANMGGAMSEQLPPRLPARALDTEPRPELPSEDLRWRVAGHRDAQVFWDTGAQSVANVNAMLSIVGKSITDYPHALDFGCGCGRMLLHMKDIAEGVDVQGVDIDPESIAWCKAHIPWATTTVTAWKPPLPFADGYFDLVFNQSVFTHLDEDYQDAWLQELMRVTKPGAAVILSVAGETPFANFIQAAGGSRHQAKYIDAFRSKGFLFIDSDGWDDGPFPDFYHSTFHAPWYIYRHWGRFFEIRAYVARGSLGFLDYLLLIRRDGVAAPSEKAGWEDAESSPLPPGAVDGGRSSLPTRALRKLRRTARAIKQKVGS